MVQAPVVRLPAPDERIPVRPLAVALRTILDVPERTHVQSWMDRAGTLVSSRLLRTEVMRVLRRAQESRRAAARSSRSAAISARIRSSVGVGSVTSSRWLYIASVVTAMNRFRITKVETTA